uniref:Uncharacterized protein n=1 Tax=Arundo donax TaxID=35708 RepID=A0A0A9H9U6_ARUDO
MITLGWSQLATLCQSYLSHEAHFQTT